MSTFMSRDPNIPDDVPPSLREVASFLGRKGGLRRAETQGWRKIPKKRRKQIAKNAAKAREAKKKKSRKKKPPNP
jgi:hypothetical protein